MIKRLKTIEQLQKEFKTNNVSSGNSITFIDADGKFKGKIVRDMFRYFGEYIDVEKYKDKKPELKSYNWKIIIKSESKYSLYYFQDDWFEPKEVVYSLPEELFEI